jgi:hypothetical protein
MNKPVHRYLFTAIGLAMLSAMAAAEEIPAGTVVSAANLDELQNQTFEGHRLGDLLTEKMQMWVREHGLKLPLRPSEPIELDPRYLEATRENAGKAVFDSQTHTVQGHVAGIPFPTVSEDDPDAAWKLIWNHRFANPVIPNTWTADAPIFLTTADGGIVKRLRGSNYRLRMRGRYTGDPATFGDGSEHVRLLLALSQPYDVAGLGIFQVQYADGRPDDVWVYVKSIRRVRRTSGLAAWMDPQPQMDLLNDDNQGIDAFPTWYRDFKLVGKRWILAVMHAPNPNEPHGIEDRLELEPPYWNPTNIEWEPREVYVIEATPPPEHPYGRKVMYMDTEFPTFHMSELYDRKGDFWRIWRQSYAPIKSVDGYPGIGFIHTQALDFQFRRATYIDAASYQINDPAIQPEQFNANLLARFAAGQEGVR